MRSIAVLSRVNVIRVQHSFVVALAAIAGLLGAWCAEASTCRPRQPATYRYQAQLGNGSFKMVADTAEQACVATLTAAIGYVGPYTPNHLAGPSSTSATASNGCLGNVASPSGAITCANCLVGSWTQTNPVCPDATWTLYWQTGLGDMCVKSTAGCFIRDDSPPNAEPLSCPVGGGPPPSKVGDPINPSTGSVIDTVGDCKSSMEQGLIAFNRYYDSGNVTAGNMGPSWRGSFSRRVQAISQSLTLRQYVPGSPHNSSLFDDEAIACTSGFQQIKNRVPNWAGAIAQYVNGICQLSRSNVVIGSIPIYSNSNLPVPLPTPIAYDVFRDDGQTIRFVIQGGAPFAPPSVTLKLRISSSGFTVTDANDNIETYDANGVLQSVKSRAGIVQTMGYDVSGRLSTVTDSFGHRLTFMYDTQGRIISVNRQ